MASRVHFRFWLESLAAVSATGLAIVTLFWKDWIEAVFGVDPDRHSGAVEWLVVFALFAAAVLLGRAARIEWRRSRLTIAPPDLPRANG